MIYAEINAAQELIYCRKERAVNLKIESPIFFFFTKPEPFCWRLPVQFHF